MLGRMIADRVARGGASPGQSEARMLLFAALMLADELHELHKQLPPPGSAEPEPAQELGAKPSAAVIARIESLAARVEKLAAQLDEPAS
jgi:cell division protein ZapA